MLISLFASDIEIDDVYSTVERGQSPPPGQAADLGGRAASLTVMFPPFEKSDADAIDHQEPQRTH